MLGIKHDEFTNNEEFFEVHIFKYRWLQIKSCFTMSNNFWSTKTIFDGKLRTYSVNGRLTFAVSVITLYQVRLLCINVAYLSLDFFYNSVFMCSSAYLRLKHDKNEYMELCPVAPVHRHEKGGGEPVYFSDLVVNSSKKQVLFVLFYLFTTGSVTELGLTVVWMFFKGIFISNIYVGQFMVTLLT